MNDDDEIEFEMLPDGTLKITTDPISGPNHVSAEAYLRFIADKCGSQPESAPRNKELVHKHPQKPKVEQK